MTDYNSYNDTNYNNVLSESGYQQTSYCTAYQPTYYTATHNKQPPQNVTVLVYDICYELLWSGTNTGWITCNYHNTLNYTRVRFNINVNKKYKPQSVIAIFTQIQNITVVGSTSILQCSRGGRITHIYNINTDNNDTIVCAIQPDINNPFIFYVTNTNQLYSYNILQCTATQCQFDSSDAKYLCVASERNILALGRTDGYIETRDQRQQCKYTAMCKQAHPGAVCDIDIKDNVVVTCGLAQIGTERYSRQRYDSLIKVFDIRSKSLIQPIQLSNNSGCTRIQFIPTLSNTVVAINNNGMFELIDINSNTYTTTQKQIYYTKLSDNSIVDALCVSSSGQCIAFSDSYGMIQEWSAHTQSIVNTYSGEIDVVQPVATENTAGFIFDETTPLSYIQPLVSIDNSKLLSDTTEWPNRGCYNFIPPIDTSLISDLKYTDYVGYAKNPNPTLYKPNSAVTVQKFSVQLYNSMENLSTDTVQIDTLYQRVTIQIPKLGLHMYDFSRYNTSPYTGLDNLLPNSYVNSVLQILYFITDLRQLCIEHICYTDYCLTCELGLLYHMLYVSKKPNTIEPRNLLHTLKYIPECNALNLLDDSYDSHNKLKLSSKIQDFIRFMLQQLYKEITVHTDTTTQNIITLLFGSSVIKQQICQNKHHTTQTTTTTLYTKLQYPTTRQNKLFTEILQQSLCSVSMHRTKCTQCNTYELTQHRQYLTTLPQILNLSASITNDIQIDLWRQTTNDNEYWLPVYISIQLDTTTHNVIVTRLTEQHAYKNTDNDIVVYKLFAVISHIIDTKSSTSALNQHHGEHLVVHINTDSNKYYCFNDFVINASSAVEATNFTYSYKIPSQVMYQRINAHVKSSDKLHTETKSIYYDLIYKHFDSLSPYTQHEKLHFTPLTPDEILDNTTQIAIDCEFVEVQSAVTENTIIVRPARLALARVSILRSDGHAFIDDYICETEPVVDYLTQYSGIHIGDLSPQHSTHYLQSLKQVSIKLRSLIDRGCVFIGHGLKSDFLMINVYVPSEQIIDTVELYYIESYKRRLSLRFLARYVLNMTVQESEHDSIQDANTARLLYMEYCKWKLHGMQYVTEKLKELYQIGNVSGFKV